jgi:hypothetical protein
MIRREPHEAPLAKGESMQGQDSRNIDLRVGITDAGELDEVRAAAQAETLSAEEASTPSDELSADIEPITMLLIGGGILAAAKFIAGWLDKRRGGLVIDQRDGAKDDLHRDPDLPWGYIVIYAKDGGEVKIETRDEPKDAIERLIAQIVSGGYKAAADLAAAAKDTLTDTSKVSTSPATAPSPS